MIAGIAWNFIFRSALFSNLTNPISDVLKRNLLLDSINTITIAEIKQAVFTIALILKKGISELLIDKSNNLVMPKTMPLWKKLPRSIPTINAPKQTSKFSVVSNDNTVVFLYPNNA